MNGDSETFVGGDPSRSITLTMRQGPNPGQRFTVDAESVDIGRSPNSDISISDKQISRHHASITWENDQFVIKDLGSANGTTVNGTTLSGPCPIHDGDVIGLGDVMLTFQGTTGMTDHGGDTFVRPSPSSASPPPASAAQQPGTIPMPPPAKKSASTAILIGAGLAAIIGLIVVAGVLVFFVFQSEAGPKISVQQPLSGSQAQVGVPITIQAMVRDPKGVSRVELWVNNMLEATIASGVPGGQKELLVQQSWTPQTSGVHDLSLRATNTAGETSEPFNITINVVEAGPEETITPTSGTPAGAPTGTTQPSEPSPDCTNNAAFVADVTVPDNSVFPPGARIDKTWRLRNTGSCPWQTGYQLVFISGDKMNAPDSQAVVPTAPGGTADVTVTMYAPNNPGTYKSVWRMINNTGQQFGQSITVLIQVPSPDTSTPTVTPTATPTSPSPPGPIVQLTVDNTNINAGDCTMVRSSVQNVTAAWLDGDPIVGGTKEKQVCPCTDTTYNLEAVPPSGPHIFRNVTVHVSGVCPADKPDLVVRDLEVDGPAPVKFIPTNFKMRIKNEGGTPASNFSCAWNPVGSTWIVVGSNITLAPGEDKWINWSYTYSAAGTYGTKAVVDYTNTVDESDEGNNDKNLTFTVLGLPPPPPPITPTSTGQIQIVTPQVMQPLLPGQINPAILTAIAVGP